jgi:site-specific DNA-cytosine methylase
VKAAANHSDYNCELHNTNFPDTEHYCFDLVDDEFPKMLNMKGKEVQGRYLDPADLPRARFAWFSPSCTNHSQANAKKIYARGLQQAMAADDDWDEQQYVNSERSRATMYCVLRYCRQHRPEIIVVENVVEVTYWGPQQAGKKVGDGSIFRRWLRDLILCGYEYELLFLNSKFFPPCPQSRDRIYIVAWRRGNAKPNLDYTPTAYCISDRCGGKHVAAVQTWKPQRPGWPIGPRWGKYGSMGKGGQYYYSCPECMSPVEPASWMALSAIDLTNLGPTLGERIDNGDPVAANTRERIRRAYAKYWNTPPVLLPPAMAAQVATMHTAHTKDTSVRASHAGEPIDTLSQKNSQGVTVLPLYVKNNGGNEVGEYDRAGHLGDQLGTISTRGTQQYVALGAVDPSALQEHVAALAQHGQIALALVVPNRTNNTGRHAAEDIAPVMSGTVSQAVILAAAGNTSERPRQTRARHGMEQMFTQSGTAEFATAFLPVLRGAHDQSRHIGESADTVAAGGAKGGLHHGLATGMFSKINGGPGDTAWHHLDESLNTVTGRDTHGLILLPWVDQWRSDPALLTEQLATVTTHMRHSLASAPPYDGEITDDMLDQVHFRMLQPLPELSRAMAFDDDYHWFGGKGQITAALGNAVTPPVAQWIVERCLMTLGDGSTNERRVA